jgi:tetratricopeptide (TPR) repeat protein
LAIIHQTIDEHPKAIEEYEESLEIRRKLAEENPKAYLSDVAEVLYNLAILHRIINEYPKALEEYEEALEIYKKLAQENPKTYLSDVIRTLYSLSRCYLFVKEYTQSEQFVRYALELDSTQIWVKTNLAHALLFQNRFSEAENIYKELSQTIYQNDETYTQSFLEDFDEFEIADAIPEERKDDVEKIRTILKE